MHHLQEVQRNCSCKTFWSTFLVLLFVRACCLYASLQVTIRQCIDTLPTAENFKRWKKSYSDLWKLWKLCKRRQTTDHILNACPIALDTGRYTWRHNCVVNYIVNSVDEKFTAYGDLPDHIAPGGGSIPPELCVTVQKPDIVIINKHKKTVHPFKLTLPLDRGYL